MPPGRRERAKAAKRARILAAARAQLLERGYAAMSMSEVARRADVAAGTVFQYASTKAELLMLVTAAAWHEREGFAAGDRPASITQILQPLVDVGERWPDLTTAVAREVLFGADGPLRREVLGLVDRLEDAMAQCLAAEGATSEQATAGARLIVTGALAELHRSVEGRADGRSLRERVGEIIALVSAGAAGAGH